MLNRIFAFLCGAAIILIVSGCSKMGAEASGNKAHKDHAPNEAIIDAATLAQAAMPDLPHADPLIQIGPWVPSPSNTEEPLLNIIHASKVTWTGGGLSTQELYDAGHLSSVTGLPVSLPNRKTLGTDVFITGKPKTFYDGDWVLEWDGDADLGLLFFPDHLISKRSKGRIEFTRDAASGATPYHMAIQVYKIRSPVTGLRLFRKENEYALRLGKIFSPRFIEEIAKYHVVRDMDLVEANRAFITTVDELATLEACCWGNTAWTGPPRKTDHPFRSMPLEAVFAMAVEADNALWHTAPIELGSPKRLYDLVNILDENDAIAGGFRGVAEHNAAAILASPEWDKYADKFVAALIYSGYSSDRILYTTVSNEVWNLAFQYFVTTNYAWGLGLGIDGNGIFRNGYGAALARWKLALEAALRRADRTQNVVYVVESQAANPATTREALRAAKKFIESQGELWADHSPAIGVSVASYWSGGVKAWPNSRAAIVNIKNDPDGAARKWSDFIINGPETVIATKAWVLQKFAAHARESANFNVRIMGAYEGGSHESRPGSIPWKWYRDYHWGPEGARANQAVNDALAVAYPGIILSNYVLSGQTGGQPWFDGLYGADNDMQRSWEQYQRRLGD